MPEGVAPWTQYQSPAQKPWEQFAAPAQPEQKPWEMHATQTAAPQERALPWETAKPGQQQAHWSELPGAFGQMLKEMWGGIKSAASLPGETFTEGLKGNLPGGLGGAGGPQDFEDRATNLAATIVGGGGVAGTGKGVARAAAEQPVVKAVQKLLSPQSVSPVAGEAAASIRAAGGQAARDTASTAAALEPFHTKINSLPEQEQLDFINHVEGGNKYGGVPPKTPPANTNAEPLVNVGTGTKEEAKQAAQFLRDLGHTPKSDPEYFKDPIKWAKAAGWETDPAKIAASKESLRNMGFEPKDFVWPRDPQLQSLADELKTAAELRETKLRALSSTAQMEFRENYLAHFWQDKNAPAKLENARRGPGKQGSGASLKKRTIPTYAEGIALGLKPLTTDPIEITMRYVASMDRFIAAEEVREAGLQAGNIKYFSPPKVMGASGHPNAMGHNVAPSGPIPEGWVPLKGRAATNHLGQTAYAPEDWARVYNNYISRGFHDIDEDLGRGVDAFQRASNAVSAVQLGLSGYHAFNIVTSGIASDIGRAVSHMAGGQFLKGLKAGGSALITPIREATPWSRGKKFEQVYLGRSPGTPDMRRIIDAATKAGARMSGKGHASDYSFSPAGSFFTAWKRGALKMEMRESLSNIKGPKTAIVELGKNVGRMMETISDPLFKTYIPRMKNAALYDILHDWLEANPLASHAEQEAMARKLVDAMDHRYGEMIQDHIFWNKAFKQTAQSAMLSYSWTLGIAKQVKRGVFDGGSLSIKSKNYNPDMAGLIGAAVAIPLVGAIYQYLKTGKPPEDMHDVMAPRSGGEGYGATVPSKAPFHKSQQARVPERAMLPSHERDIFGWWYEPGQEFKNKFAALPRAGIEWFFPGPTDVDLADYLKIVGESMAPISIQQLQRGHMQGSAMGPAESLAGIRPAPSYLQDPEGYAKSKEVKRYLDEKRKTAIERKIEQKYGGPME